jgi:hypothetical protein
MTTPTATILGQHCTVFLDANGVQQFKIASSIDAVLPGDLPIFGAEPYTSSVFVHQIVVTTDPKSDVFLRVANVADLTTLPLGRETAMGAGQTIYLSAEFSVTYSDIATASQAKVLIQQRVDNLIADWHTYNDTFLSPLNAPTTPPYTYSNITLPLTLSLETALKSAYNTAHAEYLTAKAAGLVAAANLTAAAAAASTANAAASSAVADSQQCSTLLGQYNQGTTAIDSFRSAMNTLLVQSRIFDTATATYQAAVAVYRALTTPSGGDKSTLDTASSVFSTAKSVWEGYITSATSASQAEALSGEPILTALHTGMSTACTSKIGAVAIAATAKSTADIAAATAVTEKKAADEAEASATLADSAAYLAVKDLCPTFERTVP